MPQKGAVLLESVLGAVGASVLWVMLVALSASAQMPASTAAPQSQPAPPVTMPAEQQQPGQQTLGSISGTVVDPTGAAVARAHVKLAREDQSASQATQANQEVLSGEDGKFAFADLAPGPYQLTIAAEGFRTQTFPAILHPGEACVVPQIALILATETTEVKVGPGVAEEQIKEQEQQRVLGVVPNFYVTYVPNAVPLDAKQKFELAWKTTIDPVTFVITGAVAGFQQANNSFRGYGQGAQGYGKRFGASYADTVTGNFIGGAILPSLLKQDPRYFYKGTGSKRSRILYAISRSVICKGDNGRWQLDYSGILGSLAAGGISNLYYPEGERNDVALTFENTLIGIGENAGENLFQEFVVRKLTPIVAKRQQSAPKTQPAGN